jgi:hypothetical protein
MTCSFCGNEARPDRAFSSAESGVGEASSICHDCVRDFYIAMIAAEMRPRSAPRPNIARGASRTAQVIRLYPRDDSVNGFPSPS